MGEKTKFFLLLLFFFFFYLLIFFFLKNYIKNHKYIVINIDIKKKKS